MCPEFNSVAATVSFNRMLNGFDIGFYRSESDCRMTLVRSGRALLARQRFFAIPYGTVLYTFSYLSVLDAFNHGPPAQA
jgi:hypothetical protein